ncbi:hypothetical protein BJ508DRAFT_323154 [Ascobolus immersus RN42]|uniref:Uncharacterized protein n=1 Tax=Ascobolus immersus RN42 TaxID=1160509 RepID=A0A3N4IH60_ASCIM|nr:hypothetical protein BJ508DRAFT_323154 [Ascobolus immersus RN42]
MFVGNWSPENGGEITLSLGGLGFDSELSACCRIYSSEDWLRRTDYGGRTSVLSENSFVAGGLVSHRTGSQLEDLVLAGRLADRRISASEGWLSEEWLSVWEDWLWASRARKSRSSESVGGLSKVWLSASADWLIGGLTGRLGGGLIRFRTNFRTAGGMARRRTGYEESVCRRAGYRVHAPEFPEDGLVGGWICRRTLAGFSKDGLVGPGELTFDLGDLALDLGAHWRLFFSD